MIEKVATIYERNARQVVEQLRQAADSIEQGKCEFEVRGAVLVVAGKTGEVDVYSWGELDNYTTLGVIARGARHVHKIIEGVQ